MKRLSDKERVDKMCNNLIGVEKKNLTPTQLSIARILVGAKILQWHYSFKAKYLLRTIT